MVDNLARPAKNQNASKNKAYQVMTSDYVLLKFTDIWGKLFSNFYLWKDIVGKKVSKLKSTAELRAFYGNHI